MALLGTLVNNRIINRVWGLFSPARPPVPNAQPQLDNESPSVAAFGRHGGSREDVDYTSPARTTARSRLTPLESGLAARTPALPVSSDHSLLSVSGGTLVPATDRLGDTSPTFQNNEHTLVDVGDENDPENLKSYDPEEMRRTQAIEAHQLAMDGWHEHEIVVIQKIAYRGLEPLMPDNWLDDFPSLPRELFGSDEEAFIRHRYGREYRAIKYLNDLILVGSRVRDAITYKNHTRPEIILAKAIKNYLKWAMQDGKVDTNRAPPIYFVCAQSPTTTVEQMQAVMKQRLNTIAAKYQEIARRGEIDTSVPVLWGFICTSNLVACTSYNLANTEPELSNVCIYTYDSSGKDVWHALGIAIAANQIRNVMMDIQRDIEVSCGPRSSPLIYSSPAPSSVLSHRRAREASAETTLQSRERDGKSGCKRFRQDLEGASKEYASPTDTPLRRHTHAYDGKTAAETNLRLFRRHSQGHSSEEDEADEANTTRKRRFDGEDAASRAAPGKKIKIESEA
ncbi:hypothetical protein BDY21DRAFT_362577 [Lineolata rhizophorae]|uniref:Uncharacterized protein n=1 Tax=Lineolata rhizophorae TaxID=578093 RepID=A0A6A6P5B7_9PEZI|nr:hypothetical protein BDY21DRAFT_362577 [Lineolata rhizophorae]